jgi:hypothetical protein
VILHLDDEPWELVSLERELGKRYGADYRVVCKDSQRLALYRRMMKSTFESFALASPASGVRRDTRDQPESGKT